jgi:hypothetical protein
MHDLFEGFALRAVYVEFSPLWISIRDSITGQPIANSFGTPSNMDEPTFQVRGRQRTFLRSS